ncbi:Ras GTPase ras2 [Entomortierella beljakovae]|nr:Ras GTPase ras2 [Entomortierella beljakovae]
MMLYKLVVLGDGGVGKIYYIPKLNKRTEVAPLLEPPYTPAYLKHNRRRTRAFTYDPTIEDSYRKQVVIDDQTCVLEVLDTAGQEEYTALRDQWIRDGEGFLLVYSIAARSTFERIKRFRDQITRVKDTENVPLMLVGNKCDKLTEREVSRDEGYQMSKLLRCDFTETSAKTCVNVERSFYNVVRMIRQQRDGGVPQKKPTKKKTKCTIL